MRSKEGTMISYKRDVSCESMSIEQRRFNDPFTREIHVMKSWGAKKAQWSLYKRYVCYEIMSIELWKWQCHPRFDYVHSSVKHKQQTFQMIFSVCLSKALVCYLEGKGKGDCFIYRFSVCYGALHGLRKELWHKKAQWSFCKRDVCHSQGAWNCGGGGNCDCVHSSYVKHKATILSDVFYICLSKALAVPPSQFVLSEATLMCSIACIV